MRASELRIVQCVRYATVFAVGALFAHFAHSGANWVQPGTFAFLGVFVSWAYMTLDIKEGRL